MILHTVNMLSVMYSTEADTSYCLIYYFKNDESLFQ